MQMQGNRTEGLRHMLRKQIRRQKNGKWIKVPKYPRPTSRADCEYASRPCPFVGCRYNLFLDVRPSGSVTFPHGRRVKDLAFLRETCALDVARKGPRTLDDIASFFAVTRERARQMMLEAMESLALAIKREDVQD